MKTGPAGLALIKEFEGCRLKAYLCPAKVWTIGYGHTSAAGAPAVTEGLRIPQAEADAILVRDLAKYEQAVERAVTVPMSQGQFDALVSLCFNIGPNAFAKSSVVRNLNRGDAKGACAAIGAWNKAGGKVLAGLVRRRKAEQALFASKAPAAPAPSFPDKPAAIPSKAGTSAPNAGSSAPKAGSSAPKGGEMPAPTPASAPKPSLLARVGALFRRPPTARP